MSNKLVKGDDFNKLVPHALTVLSPFAEDDILGYVLVVVQKDTSAVELAAKPSHILHKEGTVIDLLKLGIDRIKDIHKGRTQGEIVLPS